MFLEYIKQTCFPFPAFFRYVRSSGRYPDNTNGLPASVSLSGTSSLPLVEPFFIR